MTSPRGLCGTDELPDGAPIRDVDHDDAYVEAGVRQHLCSILRILTASVGEQKFLAGTDPPRDGDSDQAGTNGDNHLSHAFLL